MTFCKGKMFISHLLLFIRYTTMAVIARLFFRIGYYTTCNTLETGFYLSLSVFVLILMPGIENDIICEIQFPGYISLP